MQTSDLVARIAAETGVSRRVACEMVDTATELIAESLERGEKVVIAGFGAFPMREWRARRA
jgi:nucleoid DNA-binding protein